VGSHEEETKFIVIDKEIELKKLEGQNVYLDDG
jgi:hypothetical protein